MAIDPKGMVSWSLIAGKACCPICDYQFEPVTCACNGCLWACKLDNCGKLQHFEGGYRAVSADKYHCFEEKNNKVQ